MKLFQYILFITSFLAIVSQGIGQDGLQINGAQLTVGSKATLYVNGNLSSTGNIFNMYNIVINGNWESSGKYSSNGSIFFVGGDQTISNFGSSFNNVTINGGGLKSVPTSFGITDSLNLLDGVVTPNDTAHIIAEENAIISDGDEYSHINGMLYHTGKGQKYYPLGKDEVFLPIQFDVLGGDAIVGFELFNGFETTPIDSYPVINIQTEHYWKQNIIAGQLDSSILSIPFEILDIETHNEQVIVESSDLLAPFTTTHRNWGEDGEGYYAERLSDLGLLYISNLNKLSGSYFATGVEQLFDPKLYYVPNALSPNADDPEDRVIKIYGSLFYPSGFNFKVVNQWGNIVFKSTDLEFMETVGWDGTNSKTKKKETTGQYQYVFNGKLKNGEYHSEAGALYIID